MASATLLPHYPSSFTYCFQEISGDNIQGRVVRKIKCHGIGIYRKNELAGVSSSNFRFQREKRPVRRRYLLDGRKYGSLFQNMATDRICVHSSDFCWPAGDFSMSRRIPAFKIQAIRSSRVHNYQNPYFSSADAARMGI